MATSLPFKFRMNGILTLDESLNDSHAIQRRERCSMQDMFDLMYSMQT